MCNDLSCRCERWLSLTRGPSGVWPGCEGTVMRALLTGCGYQSAATVSQSVIERTPRGTERFPVDHAAAQLQSASSSYAWPKERLAELPIVQLGELRRSCNQRDITK